MFSFAYFSPKHTKVKLKAVLYVVKHWTFQRVKGTVETDPPDQPYMYKMHM